MERFLWEFAVRAALMVLAAAVVLRVLRIRAAAAQHAVWVGVLVAMLALPVWMTWGPKAALSVLPARAESAAGISADPASAVADLPPIRFEIPEVKRAVWNWDAVWISVYLLGAGALLLRLAIGTVRAQWLTSASCVSPVTVGLLRPRVILPENWNAWPPAQLDAVLTHERAHVRRRDPLFQWLALFHRAVFWFHPLSWWLERRISALAEEACDAAVLQRGHDPRDYSAYLIELARAVRSAGTRVNAVAMGMPGSYLPQRVRKILDGARLPGVSRAKMACAAGVCAISSAMFAAGTLEHTKPPRPVPVLLAQAKTGPAAGAEAPVSSPSAAPAAFEVASIRQAEFPSDAFFAGYLAGGGTCGGRSSMAISGNRVTLSMVSLCALIRVAYDLPDYRISGAPNWMTKADRSIFYSVQAEAPGDGVLTEERAREMLRTLLADRFHLKLHRETKELSVYALVVGKNGPKLSTDGQVVCGDRSKEDLDKLPAVTGFRSCKPITTMARLAEDLSRSTDRPVVDKTGLTGQYAVSLLWTPEGRDLQPNSPPSLFTAIQEQLGLKLEPLKAAVDALVIDQAEKPTVD